MCTLISKLYGAGFEVADFTDSGATLAGLDQLTLRDRIATARTKLAQCVGISEDNIVGFRWAIGSRGEEGCVCFTGSSPRRGARGSSGVRVCWADRRDGMRPRVGFLS